MVKRRRTSTRSWARGIFAFFWIVLAGASGLYLFTLFTDPAALGGQSVQLSAVTGDEMATGAAEAPPPVPVPAANSGDSAEVTKLKGTIRALSQQVAELNARLTPIEKFIGPVAALPPSASVTTSPPKPPAPVQAAPAASPAASSRARRGRRGRHGRGRRRRGSAETPSSRRRSAAARAQACTEAGAPSSSAAGHGRT